jgi:hypothetical protein
MQNYDELMLRVLLRDYLGDDAKDFAEYYAQGS